jgi:hypothetical protein
MQHLVPFCWAINFWYFIKSTFLDLTSARKKVKHEKRAAAFGAARWSFRFDLKHPQNSVRSDRIWGGRITEPTGG